MDDLFKETTDPSAARRRGSRIARRGTRPNVDDLFAEPAPGADKSTSPSTPNAMRLWTDNTGKYRVTARLVMVSQTHVRLLKENGQYTTVPFSRLSQADVAFVRQHWTGMIASK